MTVKIDTSSPEGLHATLEGLLSAQSDTQVALAKLAGPGITTEAALEGSGVAAFRAKSGGLRLVDSVRRDKVAHEGEDYIVETTAPGLFSAGAAALLSEQERAVVTAYKGELAEVNVCKLMGLHKTPTEQLGRLLTLAAGAPLSLRAELTQHAQSIAAAGAASMRQSGRFASSSANTSGNPGYNWVADSILPDVLDVTNQEVGLYDLAIRRGAQGLHQTAKMKVRVLTATGGMRMMGRQITDTVGVFPKVNVTTDVAEITGGRAVHSSIIDGLSTRDPREAIDWLALHRRAGELGSRAFRDFVLLHGDQQTAPSSHAYAVAGLQALVLDHRDAPSAGDATDPLISADGLRTFAVDRSCTVDLGTLIGSAATVWSTQANALTSYSAMRALQGDQYKRGSVLVVTQTVADLMAKLAVGVLGTPFMRPLTVPGNPFVVGELYDGTLVVSHYGVGKLWNSSGVVASGGSLNAAFLANLNTVEDIAGPDDGRVTVVPQGDGDAVIVTTFAQSRPWCPLTTAKKAFAFGYNS